MMMIIIVMIITTILIIIYDNDNIKSNNNNNIDNKRDVSGVKRLIFMCIFVVRYFSIFRIFEILYFLILGILV